MAEGESEHDGALKRYVSKVQEHREFESRVKKLRETVTWFHFPVEFPWCWWVTYDMKWCFFWSNEGFQVLDTLEWLWGDNTVFSCLCSSNPYFERCISINVFFPRNQSIFRKSIVVSNIFISIYDSTYVYIRYISRYHFRLTPYFFTKKVFKVKKNSVDYDKSEDHLKALQSVGQIIGEVLSLSSDWLSQALRNCPNITKQIVYKQGTPETLQFTVNHN